MDFYTIRQLKEDIATVVNYNLPSEESDWQRQLDEGNMVTGEENDHIIGPLRRLDAFVTVAEQQPETPTTWFLAIDGIKTASFRHDAKSDTTWRGTVYDEVTDQEYDVERVQGQWRINDDLGRNWYGNHPQTAINAARKGNR